MKVKKNKRSGIATYQFPYYKKNQGFFGIFLIKALFAYVLSYCGAGLFAVLLEMDTAPAFPAVAAGLACVVTFVLLGFFRKLYVGIFAAVVLGITFTRVQLLPSGQDFLRQLFEVSDGNIIKTSQLIEPSEVDDPIPFFILLCVIFGVLCAFSSSRRFHPIAILTFSEIMMIPAFFGQSMHFSWWLAVFIAAVMGLWAVTVSAAADVTLSSGYSSNLHMSDYVYIKANKKLLPAQKIRSDTLHFGKHISDSITVFIVVLLIIGITASNFPTDGSMKLDEIALEAINITKNTGYWLYDIFGGSAFKGFFSADGGSIDISGNVNPEDLPTGNRPVADITSENKDKLYLRGDIGYTFKGDQWESIAKIDYGKISFDDRYTMMEVLNSYAPEIQYYLFRYGLNNAFLGADSYVGVQTVKVDYLQDINTLLIPGTPSVYNFRENNNFSIYGDFVAIADKGRVNSMKTAVLYRKDDISSVIDGVYSYSLSTDTVIPWELLSVPLSIGEYNNYISSYRDFVYDYYTDVPDEELENIRGFIAESVGKYFLSRYNTYFYDIHIEGSDGSEDSYVSYIAGNMDYMPMRSEYATFLEEYLTSGAFTYSLDTDNFSGGNTFLGNFLNDTRAGHCALFATTMCLALRYLGVPARYVTGFTVGGDECVKTDEGYTYTVLEKDLHAWVEVYYDGIGWIPYDPTPGRGGNTGTDIPIETTIPRTTPPTITTPADTTESTTTTTTPPKEETTTGEDTLLPPDETGNGSGAAQGLSPETVRIILIAVGAVLAVLVIALSTAGALKTLRRKERQLIGFFRTGDTTKAVGDMFAFTLKILDMMGVQRRSGETPTEFAKRADRTLRAGLGIGLEQVMPLFQRAEFDRQPAFNEEERQAVYSTVSKLYGELMISMRGPKQLITRIRLFGKVKIRPVR